MGERVVAMVMYCSTRTGSGSEEVVAMRRLCVRGTDVAVPGARAEVSQGASRSGECCVDRAMTPSYTRSVAAIPIRLLLLLLVGEGVRVMYDTLYIPAAAAAAAAAAALLHSEPSGATDRSKVFSSPLLSSPLLPSLRTSIYHTTTDTHTNLT